MADRRQCHLADVFAMSVVEFCIWFEYLFPPTEGVNPDGPAAA